MSKNRPKGVANGKDGGRRSEDNYFKIKKNHVYLAICVIILAISGPYVGKDSFIRSK